MSNAVYTDPSAPPPMTGDEFFRLHGGESNVELVRGYVRRLPMPGGRHGEVCSKANYYLTQYAMEKGTGRVLGNDSLIRTGENPDTHRGVDVCFISYARLAKDQPTPAGPLLFAPDLVVEVRSPTDRTGEVQVKIGEYLLAGVPVVLVLDPKIEAATIYRDDEELPQRRHNGDELTLPDVLPGFAVPVRKFFE